MAGNDATEYAVGILNISKQSIKSSNFENRLLIVQKKLTEQIRLPREFNWNTLTMHLKL